jgi:PiT family inorganic phosphate transporter
VAAQLGIPVSTTQTIGSSIMGVGATKRFSAVRWGVAGDVVAAWVLTWPSCMVLGYVLGKGFGALT